MSNSPLRGMMDLAKKNKRLSNEESQEKPVLIKEFPLFRNIKPKKHFIFKSDYFQVDDQYAVILTVFHRQGSDDSLGYFWGIKLIPNNLGNDISVRRLEHVGRMSESWVEQNQGKAEGLMSNQANETNKEGSLSARQRLSKQQEQLVEIAQDLMNGASYLRVAIRLLVKAPTLEKLDEAVNKINRQYKDRFDTVYAAPYVGEQKRELSTIFNKVEGKLGKNFMFTSTEFSGSYSLVTRGIEDKTGEYIGQMDGDVNNSAVLMDLDKYDSHVVIAGRLEAQTLSGYDFGGEKGADVWGAKLGMNALLRNHKVVHLVMNRSKVADIGVDLSDITAHVNMNQGDINPFEMFGQKEDELSIFPAHVEKIFLMVEQLQPTANNNAARIKGALQEVLNDFYVDKRMWARNAKENRDALRIVGIPHKQVPKLPEFQAYLDMKYHEQVQARNKDPEVMNAYGFLKTVFQDMLDTNGDLFNTITASSIDRAAVSSRVVYDFSSLIKRGRGLMMAQFVNALGYSVGNLKSGDVLILHGAEHVVPEIRQYVRDQLDQLSEHGVRVVMIYHSVDKMLEDRVFNQFESADYTMLGGMTKSQVLSYEEAIRTEVPYALKSLMEHKEAHRWYLRRGFDNIVFANDILMGFEQ